MNNKTEKLATIILADIPDIESYWPKELGRYKFRFYISMIGMFTCLKPVGSMMLFFNPEYKSWVPDVLKKFEVMTYKWIIHSNDRIRWKESSRYGFCYRLVKKPSFMDNRKPRSIDIKVIDGTGFLENLLLNYSDEGDVVYDCFGVPNEIQSLCDKNWREYITMND